MIYGVQDSKQIFQTGASSPCSRELGSSCAEPGACISRSAKKLCYPVLYRKGHAPGLEILLYLLKGWLLFTSRDSCQFHDGLNVHSIEFVPRYLHNLPKEGQRLSVPRGRTDACLLLEIVSAGHLSRRVVANVGDELAESGRSRSGNLMVAVNGLSSACCLSDDTASQRQIHPGEEFKRLTSSALSG